MSQAGVSTAPARARRRQVIDFGVDERWEPAPPRRMRDVAPAPVAARSREPYGLFDSNDDFGPSRHFPEAAPARAGARRRDDDLDWREDAYLPAGEAGLGPRSYTPVPAPARATAPVAARRTVTIRGRGAERDLAFPAHRTARRPSTPAHQRHGFKPDRAAMWAVFLGILLVLVAATSSHAAVARHALGVRAHRTVAVRSARVAVAAHSARMAAVRPLR